MGDMQYIAINRQVSEWYYFNIYLLKINPYVAAFFNLMVVLLQIF